MPDIKSRKKKLTDNIIEGKLSRDYSKEPFFVEKAKKAKAYLEKHGLFEKLAKKK